MPVTGRRLLVGWLLLVGIESALNYTLEYAVPKGKPDKVPALYQWSTGFGELVIYGLVLVIVVAIAKSDRDVLGWRRPESWPRALGLGLAAIVGVLLISTVVLEPLLHGGREQGLVPDSWDSQYLGPYIASGIAVVVIAPFVEETQFRGLGCSALRPFGRWVAIIGVAVAFGLAHGFVQAFPELALLGGVLAWLRFRTGSVYPGMLVHGTFNLLALLSVFWH